MDSSDIFLERPQSHFGHCRAKTQCSYRRSGARVKRAGRNLEIPGSMLSHRLGMTAQQKSPRGGFFAFKPASLSQCTSAQTFFLVKYISPTKMIRKTNT
jgi:hypothetical protein